MTKWQVNRDQYSVTMDLGPNAEWVAEMQWPEGQMQGGPAVLVIYPSDPDSCPPGGLSQTVLRDVDFKYALDRLRSGSEFAKRWARGMTRSRDKMAELLRDLSGSSITDEYLAVLSRLYVYAAGTGQEKPLEYLAGVTEKSPAAIKNHLWQATRKGLLERSPGRAGGSITPKASEILQRVIPEDLFSPEKSGKPTKNATGTRKA